MTNLEREKYWFEREVTLLGELDNVRAENSKIKSSLSWKLTAPLRGFGPLLKKASAFLPLHVRSRVFRLLQSLKVL